jgi:hypothetical protein
MFGNIKPLVKRVIPQNAHHFIRWCLNSDYRAAGQRERFRKLTLAVYDLADGRVLRGPFQGLQYVRSDLIGGACKLLGTYEQELSGAIERIIAKGFATVIDIGAAEGYYAVGLAMRMPDTRVVCYEMEDYHQDYIRRLAEINGVGERVEIHGYCDRSGLAQCLAAAEEPIAVICDVEGSEYDLLDPASMPRLKNAEILVELHDMFRKGVSKALHKRFAPTHRVTRLHSMPRTGADFPAQVNLDVKLRASALDEDRGETMYWYWMEANDSPHRHQFHPIIHSNEESVPGHLPIPAAGRSAAGD